MTTKGWYRIWLLSRSAILIEMDELGTYKVGSHSALTHSTPKPSSFLIARYIHSMFEVYSSFDLILKYESLPDKKGMSTWYKSRSSDSSSAFSLCKKNRGYTAWNNQGRWMWHHHRALFVYVYASISKTSALNVCLFLNLLNHTWSLINVKTQVNIYSHMHSTQVSHVWFKDDQPKKKIDSVTIYLSIRVGSLLV